MADGTIKIAVDLDTAALEAALAKIPQAAEKSLSGTGKVVTNTTKTMQTAGKQLETGFAKSCSAAGKALEALGKETKTGASAATAFGKQVQTAGTQAAKGAATAGDAFKGAISAGNGFDAVTNAVDMLGKGFQIAGGKAGTGLRTPMETAVQAGVTSVGTLAQAFSDGPLATALQTTGSLFTTLGTTISEATDAEKFSGLEQMAEFCSNAGEAISSVAEVTDLLNQATAMTATEAAAATTATLAQSAATGVQTITTNAATVAQHGLNAAMKANIIGMIVSAIGLAINAIKALVEGISWLIGKFKEQKKEEEAATAESKRLAAQTEALKEETEEACDANKRFNDSVASGRRKRREQIEDAEASAAACEQLADTLYDLALKEEKSTEEKAMMQSIVQKLNDEMPDLKLQFDEETGALNLNKDAVFAAIDAKKKLAKQNAMTEILTDAYKNEYKAELELTQLKERRATAQKELNKLKGVSDMTETQKNYFVQLGKTITDCDTAIANTRETLAGARTDVEFATSKFGDIFNDAGDAATDMNHKIADAFVESGQKIINNGGTMQDAAATVFDNIDTIAAEKGLVIGDDLKASLQSTISNGGEGVFSSLRSIILYAIDGVGTILPQAETAGETLVNTFGAGISAASGNLTSHLSPVAQILEGGFNKTEIATQGAKNTLGGFTSTLQTEGAKIPEIAEKIGKDTTEKFDQSTAAEKSTNNTMNTVKSTVQTGGAPIAGAASNVMERFVAALKEGQQPAKSAFENVIEHLKNGGSLESLGEYLKKSGYTSLSMLAEGIGESEDTVKQRMAEACQISTDEVQTIFEGAGGATVKNASENLMNSIGTTFEQKAESARAAASGVGQYVAEGIASGIDTGTPAITAAARRAIDNAVAAAKQQGEIHSPSKLFEGEVGVFLAKGIAKGIEDGTDDVVKAAEELIDEAAEVSPKAAEIGRQISEALMESGDREIQEEAEENLATFQKYLDKLDIKRKYNQISEQEYYEELDRLRNRYLTIGTKEWYDYGAKVFDYEKNALEAHKENIRALYDDIQDYANERTAQIDDLRSSMESKLQGYGSLFSIEERSEEDGPTRKVLQLGNLQQTNQTLLRYEQDLLQLKERITAQGFDSSVAEGFFGELAELDIEDAMFYAETLISLKNAEFENQIQQWKTNQDLTKAIAESLYQDQADRTVAEIQQYAIDEAAAYVIDEMDKVGMKIPEGFFESGKKSAEQFEAGFKPYFEKIVGETERILENITVNFAPSVLVTAEGVGSVVNNNHNESITIQSSNPNNTLQDLINYEKRNNLIFGGTDI